MPSSKSPIKKEPVTGNKYSIYVIMILLSLGVNAYLLINKQDAQQKLLVSAGNQSFRWKDISSQGKKAMANLDNTYYTVLKREADVWVENQVMPKEAQSRSVTVADLLKSEVLDKVQVTKDDVYKRYAQSPSADSMPWPQVLTDIENEMRGQLLMSKKQAYLDGLSAKYGVRYALKPPAANSQPNLPVTRFPLFERNVSGAPVRGAAQAPILMEVYSDFMCPYSVRFNSTVQELQKLYPDKIQIAFRHFPLPFHQGAHLMGEAAQCADEQGKFWEYHDKLMVEAKKREKPELVQIAGDLGLSSPKFVECLDSGRFAKKVDEDIALGKANGVQGTPGYMINGRRGSGAMPVDSMKPLIDWHLNPAGVYPGKPQQPANQPGGRGAGQQPSGGGLDPAKIVPLDAQWLKKGFSRGSESAPVTLVEFFDYNCPYCKKGAEVSDALAAKYGDKIQIISKHLPLPMHVNAAKTSEALLCAGEQSKFMEMRKEVLGESWGKNTPDDLKMIAKKIGLNEANFNSCLDSGKTKPMVDEDMKAASAVGVQSTPTFMINGTPVIGAQPVESFQKIIDEQLSAKK